MKPLILGITLCLTTMVLIASAQDGATRHTRKNPADDSELAGITERGRELASYDQAAWHATDAVQAQHPAKGTVGMYLGRLTGDGWVVAFGKLNDAQDAFLLAYEAEPTGDVLHPRIVINTPALEDRGEWLNEARAFDAARKALHPNPNYTYNGSVLVGPQDTWYVYFYPAQTKNEIFPEGGDTRFRVSHDGKTILETRMLHHDVLEFKTHPGTKSDMTFRTAFLDDAPEDTDVAYNMMMGGVEGYVMAPTFTYHIAADGKVTYLMTTKAFVKVMKK